VIPGRGVRRALEGCAGLLVALAGCSFSAFDPSPVPAQLPPQYEGNDAGTLAIRTTWEDCCLLEGAIHAVTVSAPWTATWQVDDGSISTMPAGDYELTFFEQVCGGNCQVLATPTYACTTRITVSAGERLDLEVVFPGSDPCQVLMP
jgi:hypothetical protein